MRLIIYFLIVLPLIIFVSKPSYSGEDAILLAMKLECGGNSAGKKPYNDYFFALTTDYTFQGNRYWIGKNKYEGDVGLNIFSGVRTDKSLLIKGEGKWLKKTSKDWKLQFISKGNKSMIEHLEVGVEGYEGKDRHRRECKLVLLNKVKAGDAIQLDSYTRVISGLKNQIDNLKKREKDKENNEEEINKINEEYNEKINSLENIIASLKEENEVSNKKIKELNDEVIETKNNTEFKTKYEDLKKELDRVNKELANNEKQLTKNKNELIAYQEKEQEEIKRNEKEEEAKKIAAKLEEEKQIEEEKKKEERKINNLKYELGSSELVVAQNLINDLLEFIKNNPEEFDIVDIAELLLENKGIIDGVWEENSQANYNKLSDFVNKSDAFRSYNQIKEDERFALAMEQLNNKYELLVAKEKELEKLLNDNLTSEFSEEILNNLKNIRKILGDYTLKKLTISNTKTQVFISDLNKRIKLKEEEVVNKNREEIYFFEKIEDLEELLSENLTTENSPIIIDKINYAKNLNTSVLNSNELNKINIEIETFIYKVENNRLITQNVETEISKDNISTNENVNSNNDSSIKKESFTGGSNLVSDFFNDVKLGMETDFSELSCKDVVNQVKGLKLQTAIGTNLDMVFFDEVVVLSKNESEIICESKITLSNTIISWYNMRLFKQNNNVFYEVTPKDASSLNITNDATSVNSDDNKQKSETGKVVFKIVYAENYIKSLDFNDEFGEFSHYGNYVGCTYRIEITNNTDHKIKINTFKISTKDTKLFSDRMSRDALIQYRQVIESGKSYVDRGMYKEGGPYKEVDQTKELPSQEQTDKWFMQYGCEAQRGNIYIKASDSLDSENIVFTKESGITEGNKNDYLIGSSEGVYPLMEKIILK